MNDLNYDFKDAQFDQLLSRRMTEDNPGDRPCSLSILEEAGMQLDKLGYQAGALKFLHSSATEGRLLFRAIIKSLDRVIDSYFLTTKEKIHEMIDRVQETHS